MFKRKKKHEVAFGEDGVQVISDDEELIAELVSLWFTMRASEPQKPQQKIGFDTDHMREVDSDTERVQQPEPVELDDEEDD